VWLDQDEQGTLTALWCTVARLKIRVADGVLFRTTHHADLVVWSVDREALPSVR
jgi:hypothetical protein